MRFGILSTSLSADLATAFRLAPQAGLEGVEVMYARPVDAVALARSNHAAELEELAAEASVEVPSLALGCLCQKPSLIGDRKLVAESVKLVRQAVSVAAEAGARVVLVPFFGKNAIETEDELNRAAEAILELVEPAESAGVVLAIESTLNFNQQEFLLNCLGGSPGVKVYYDTGNLLPRKLDVPTGIRQLGGDRIAQVHVKDVRVVEGSPPDFDVPLGRGSVDLRACAEALRAIGYDGWLILETPPGPEPLASAKENLAYLRELIGD